MKPTDALEIQRDYKSRCGDANFVRVLNSMISSASGIKAHQKVNKLYPHNKEMITLEEQTVAVDEYASSAVKVGKSNTPCYFVKDEMSDLIMFASNKLDDTDLFDEALIPSDKGFVYFEKPLEIRDVRGRQLLVNVLVWEKGFSQKTGKPIMAFTCFNDASRTPDDVAKEIFSHAEQRTLGYKEVVRIVGGFHWVHSASYEHGEVVGEAVKTIDDDEANSVRNITMDENGNFIDLDDEEWETYKKEKLYPYTNVRRLIYTYFLIMSQTLTAKAPERGDRAQRRRLERENLPSEVLVIQFRKTRYTSAEGGEERSVNWSHRWIVGGHWRWQPYKDPASGGEIKKRIWISPYVKGPDDKPLKTKERVYVLAK